MAAAVGGVIHEHRRRRGWPIRELAARAGVSPALVQHIESGGTGSLDAYARIITALDLRPELDAVDPRAKGVSRGPSEDVVHAAMGELEAGRLRTFGLKVAIDEPYQHYQFAGRADVVAWDPEARALLHIENRTRFPNIQEAAGSYNAKRSYLADDLATRWGLGRGWASVTHAIVALWSSEVLHAVRLRAQTFRALCPDEPASFEAWWAGRPATIRGVTSTFLLCDPSHGVRDGYRFATLEEALRVRPRVRDYPDAAARLSARVDRAPSVLRADRPDPGRAPIRANPPSRASRGG